MTTPTTPASPDSVERDLVLTEEEKALGAFLSAMHECKLDGGKMRKAMLKVLGLSTDAKPVVDGELPPIEPFFEKCGKGTAYQGDMIKQAMRDYARAALLAATPAEIAVHSDDAAVDRFASAMKEKLATAREKGRGGWETCTQEDLSRMLREHVEKGDPLDVANFCMFLWNLGYGIDKPAESGGEAVRYEYRWLNPANNPNESALALEWKLVEPRNIYTDTVEDRIRELESYRYDGKPVYEVRGLYTKPQADKVGGEVVRLQVNGVPPFKNPPEDVINAAFHVSDWAERNGWKNWRIGHCCSEDYTHPQPQPSALPDYVVKDAEQIARAFHDAYERLAPSFGYETRKDTRQFDPVSANGRLMIAVCREIAAMLKEGIV